MPRKGTEALAWLDYETDGLPVYGDGIVDFRNVHVLEFAIVITDLDLNPLVGHEEVLSLPPEAIENIRTNDFVREMHMANGLLAECMQSTLTEADMDGILADVCEKSTYDRGTIAMAGSGVARFDSPLSLSKLPRFASWLNYAEIDTGNTRRAATIHNHNRPVVNPVAESSREGTKAHRAMADVMAHLKEERRYQEFYRKAVLAIEEMEKRESEAARA